MKVSRPELGAEFGLGPLDHRPHDFVAGRVAECVDDAAMAVPALAAEQQIAVLQVELRAPGDQIVDVVGRFADDHLDDFLIAEIRAGDHRVGDVVLEAVLGIDHSGDAALGVGAVGLFHRVLGDHQKREPWIDFHRGPQPGNAAADHQHVDEVVRNPLGMERNEIAWHEQRHDFLSLAWRRRQRRIRRERKTRAAILLAILPRTRDALVVGPQPFLVFERHGATVALAKVAQLVVGNLGLLQLAALEAEAAKCICQFASIGVGGRAVVAGSRFELLPAVDEPLEVGFCPAQFIKQPLIDFLTLHLLGERFEHEVGLAAGVVEVGGVGVGGGAGGLGRLHGAVGDAAGAVGGAGTGVLGAFRWLLGGVGAGLVLWRVALLPAR